MALDTTTDRSGTRPRVIDYSYRYRPGSDSHKDTKEGTGKRITIDVMSVILKLIGDKEGEFVGEFEGDLAPLFSDGELPEPCMALPTAAYGLKTTLGNAVSAPGMRDASPEKQLEAIEQRYSTIAEDKEWREGRDGGPRLKYVIEAYKSYLESKHGVAMTERQLTAMRVQILQETTTEFLKKPHIRAEYDAAELVRVQARSAESRARAASAAPDASDDAILSLS